MTVVTGQDGVARPVPEPTQEAARASAYRVAALAKGLSLLEHFSDSRTSLRLTELCALTGIPMPTAFRLVATLEDAGFLERLPDSAYRPGPRVLALGGAALAGSEVVRAARPVLERLASATGETVNLGALERDRVLYLVRLHPNAALVTASIRVGSSLPAVASSLGKMLLAELAPEALDQTLTTESFEAAAGLGPGPGPRAVATREALDEQLASARRFGYVVQDEEVARGIRSIAAPVRGPGGRCIAAANVAVPASSCSVAGLVERFLDPLLAACRDISAGVKDSTEPHG